MKKLFHFVEHIGNWRVLIQTRDIQKGAVTGDKIADGTITGEKLADGIIGSEKFQDNSVGGEKIADGGVTGEKLAEGSVGSEKIAEGAVTGDKIAEGAVHDEHIAPEAITELRALLAGYVKASGVQVFDESEKAQARKNIGAGEPSARVVTQTEDEVIIDANVLNVWPVAQEHLVVAFAPYKAGYYADYMLEFTVSGDGFTLTLPEGVRWTDEPDYSNGATYQVSVVDGLAAYLEFGG